MKIVLPAPVNNIIDTLRNHGYEAYAVGGCVRDSILGRVPEDWDITTSARPQEVKALFKRTFDTGIEHGTITVLMDRVGYEVTTYRVDGDYKDHRRPEAVAFTGNLSEDLLRRDFTINAMAYNNEEGLIDQFGGKKDLEAGRICCVGNPQERFDEDALRIMRGVRFAAQLGFEIEAQTESAMQEAASTLAYISAERIRVELVKLLISPHPEQLLKAYELGITRIILPEFDRMMETEQETPHHIYSVGNHTIQAITNIEADKVLRLTMLFHDVSKPEMKTIDADGRAHFKGHDQKGAAVAGKILRRLKFDNDTISRVTRLIQHHDYRIIPSMRNVRRAVNRIGDDLFEDYIKVRRADTLAQSEYHQTEKLESIEEAYQLYQEVKRQKQCVSLKTLAVTGRDLVQTGMQPGKEIGETLKRLLDLVIEHPEYNTKEILLKHVKSSPE